MLISTARQLGVLGSESIHSHTHKDDLRFDGCLDTFTTCRPTVDFGGRTDIVASILVNFNGHLTISSDRLSMAVLLGVRD